MVHHDLNLNFYVNQDTEYFMGLSVELSEHNEYAIIGWY